MLGDVLIAEFQIPKTGMPVRLYRVLDDSDLAWSDYEQEAAGGHWQSVLGIMRKSIRSAILEEHLVSSFILKVQHGGRWAPMTGFAVVNDVVDDATGVEDMNRVTSVLDFTLTDFDREFVNSVIYWVIFELCRLEEDTDIFGRVLFELQIPAPVEDAKLDAWRVSGPYKALQLRIAKWKNEPPKNLVASQFRTNDMIEWGEQLFDTAPSDATQYDHHVVSPMDDDTIYVDAIEWAVSFEGVEQYIVALFLFETDDPDQDSPKPSSPWWGIMSEGDDPRPYEGDSTDLITALIGSRILIPASRYETWFDEHTAKPTQVFAPLDFDLEAYLLLLGPVRIPWLWPASEAQGFFTALEQG